MTRNLSRVNACRCGAVIPRVQVIQVDGLYFVTCSGCGTGTAFGQADRAVAVRIWNHARRTPRAASLV